MRRPSVSACAVVGTSTCFSLIVVAKSNRYQGSDVTTYGGSVLALIGAVLGAAVRLLVNLRG